MQALNVHISFQNQIVNKVILFMHYEYCGQYESLDFILKLTGNIQEEYIVQDRPIKQRQRRPIRVLQFGEGNFLRAFADYIIDCSNEAGVLDSNVVIVKPIDYGTLDKFDQQDNFYTVILRGIKNGQSSVETRVVSCIQKTIDPYIQINDYNLLMRNEDLRFIISNTTEAGIVYSGKDKLEDALPETFPAKVTKLLLQRYEIFDGAMDKGFIFLPVELIEKNGDNLKKCILSYCSLWGLSDGFIHWVNSANIFCNTLVDRIVSGYPKAEEEKLWQEMGYKDELIATGEPFGFWAIGSDRIDAVKKEFTVQSGVEVVFAEDIEPYKQRKVRILNGAHTAMVMGGYLAGKNIVAECMDDADIRNYMLSCIYDEIIPNIPLDKEKLKDYANSVVERFRNSFLNHKLLDICLNSTSKWRARVLPSFIDYYESMGKIPKLLTLSFAMYLSFYIGVQKDEEGYFNIRDGERYKMLDDEYALEIFRTNYRLPIDRMIHIVMSDEKLWGINLTDISGFYEKVCEHVHSISTYGMKKVISSNVHG